MLESPCPYKKYAIYPITLVVGYIGYIAYKKYTAEETPKKNYIAGGLSPINIDCEELKKTVQTFLSKYHDYTDDFTLIYGTQQVVAGIKYTLHVKKKEDSEILILNFIHRPWLEENEVFQNLDQSTE